MVRCPFIFSSYINGRGLHPLTPTPLTGMPCYHTAYSGKFYSIHLRPLGRGYTPWVRPSALGSGLRPLGRAFGPWVGPSALGSGLRPLGRGYTPWVGPSALGSGLRPLASEASHIDILFGLI